MSEKSLQARFYDWECAHFLRRQLGDVEVYDRLARKHGGPVLELGAGTGRITLELARRGHEVVALDIDPSCLEVARQAAHHASVVSRIELIAGDMRSFRLSRSFPTVIVPYNSFQCITDSDGQHAALTSIAQHLAPDGVAVFELTRFDVTATATSDWEHLVTDFFDGGSAVLAMYERIRQDHGRQLTHFDERYVLFRWGSEPETFETTLTLRTVTRYEMELLLARAGLREKALYGTYDQEPLESAQAYTTIVVAGRVA